MPPLTRDPDGYQACTIKMLPREVPDVAGALSEGWIAAWVPRLTCCCGVLFPFLRRSDDGFKG